MNFEYTQKLQDKTNHESPNVQTLFKQQSSSAAQNNEANENQHQTVVSFPLLKLQNESQYQNQTDYGQKAVEEASTSQSNIHYTDYTSNRQSNSIKRKMSLAAKSGQMQIFNSIVSQNLNLENPNIGRNSNMYAHTSNNQEDLSLNGNRIIHSRKQKSSLDQDQFDSIQSSFKISQFNNKKATPLSNLSNIQGQIKKTLIKQSHPIQNSSQSQKPPIYNLQANQKFQNNQKLEPILKVNGNSLQSHFGIQNKNMSIDVNDRSYQLQETFQAKTELSNDDSFENIKKIQKQNEFQTTGSRQFENYLQRKQIIQQQREKKQELLKQLDMGIGRVKQEQKQDQAENTLQHEYQNQVQGLRIDGIGKQEKQYPQFANSEYNYAIPISQNDKPFVQHQMHSLIGGSQFLISKISPTRGSKQLMHQHHLQGPFSNFSIQNNSGQQNVNFQNQDINENIEQDRFKKSQFERLNDNKANNDNFAKNIFRTNAQTLQLLNFQTNNNQQEQTQNVQSDANQSYDYFSQNSMIEQQTIEQIQNQQKDYVLMENKNDDNKDSMMNKENQESINKKITRKLEGGRPHKIYDYMFIQMSNEQFTKEYLGKTIIVQNNDQNRVQSKSPSGLHSKMNDANNHNFSNRKHNFLSPNKSLATKVPVLGQLLSPITSDQIDLNGIVKIKAYESNNKNELPTVQCNLLPTQLDHLKVLICEQEDKSYPKLAQDALNKFENLKQNQIKQYMDDIIQKLQQKERKFKITVKKKFIDDALYSSSQIRVASVYVIVINREKHIDINNEKQKFMNRKNNKRPLLESSSDDNEISQVDPIKKEEFLRIQRLKESLRRRENSLNNQKRSMYDSDSNDGQNGIYGDLNTTSKSASYQKKLQIDKSLSLNNIANSYVAKDGKLQKNKVKAQNVPQLKKVAQKPKEEDQNVAYKYTFQVKEYPSKYGQTKIKIIQDLNAHVHHQKHPINIFFNQYNEFIKLVLKNQKLQNQSQSTSSGPAYKFNHVYAMGLAKALGMNLKKDAFSEGNMKSREYVNLLKEKLIFCFWKKLNDSNRDLTPHLNQNVKDVNDKISASEELNGETIDSLSNQNNTPRSRNIKKDYQFDQAISDLNKAVSSTKANNFILPPPNIIYKYFIGKGNNSIMVRSLFKNRYWWVQHDKEEMEKCNFCWTQIKKPNLMEALPCKYPFMKSGIKNANYHNPTTSQIIQQIQETPQQKSSKKRRIDSQNSERAQSQNTGTTSANQSNQQQIICPQEQIQKWTECKLYNKIEDNFNLNNKKALYINMKNYYEALGQNVFDNLPLTFHIKTGLEDPEFHKFKQYYFKNEEEIKAKRLQLKLKKKEQADMKEKQNQKNDEELNSGRNSPEKKIKEEEIQKEPQYYQSPALPKNIWIIKPGENTNRGHGIQVAKEFDEIKSIIQESTTQGKRTCIVQKYIHNPLLINRRKFDIRTYVLMTSINGNTKVYIYEEGYLRTSCREYSVQNLANKLVHLTNDAVQKRAEDYGKFEPGNKLSYNEFQVFLDKNYIDLNICFERDIKSQMNKITTDIFRAVYTKLDPKRRLHCMEVFGLDFMIDDDFKPYLIEVNTNPCLELACPLLARLIPNVIENALKIGLDAQFMPPEFFSTKKAFIGDPCPENRYELVFDSIIDGPVLDQLFKNKENMIGKLNIFK